VFEPTVEFLTINDEYCVMRCGLPAGVAVSLYSHADAEDFFILPGSHQVWSKARAVWNGGTRTQVTTCA
jgi:hypothetical protein